MRTFESFAKDLGFNRQVLDNFITFADKNYQTFYISKKGKGKKRQIDSPSKELKSIQRWVLSNYINNLPVSSRANGFIKGRGIKRNAEFHLGKPYVLSMDIKEFFSSITQGMVYNALSEHFDKELSLKLAKLCTFKRRLPQGAPTSPALSNIVFKKIDEKITNYCNARLVVYSRYADDMVFSCDTKDDLVETHRYVSNLLRGNSFEINTRKTKFFSGKGRMAITGININEGRLTVRKELKRNLRSNLYNFIVKRDTSVNVNSVLGYLTFLHDIEPEYYEKMLKYISKLKRK